MTRKEKLAARKELEDYYYNCKLETPEQVAKQFEVYTKLIWNFHQAGLCYDYYEDITTTRLEGTGKWIGGHDALEVETLPTMSANPRNNSIFKQIYAVGDMENGYHFGQVTSKAAEFAPEGASAKGLGDGSRMYEDQMYTLCECVVGKVNGRWCITDEWVVSGQEASRQWMKNARPFAKTILDAYTDRVRPEDCRTVEQLDKEMKEVAEA